MLVMLCLSGVMNLPETLTTPGWNPARITENSRAVTPTVENRRFAQNRVVSEIAIFNSSFGIYDFVLNRFSRLYPIHPNPK